MALWAALTVLAVAFVFVVGSNCPNADEWEFVPALTGNEPLGPWLWAQHNEHRLPLPRLAYWVLFQLTHDFRAGSLLQIGILSGTSLGLMSLAARFRGFPHWADAFFPVSLLHVGHWENLLIGYNICFAFILALETAIGVIAIRTTRENAFRSGCMAGVLMCLLCLCGGGGVVTAMPVAAWLVSLAFIVWRPGVRVRYEVPSDESLIVSAIDCTASSDEKLNQLEALTLANRPLVDAFLKRVDARFGTTSNSNIKLPERIAAKAARPSIRAKKPWHDIEHVRDSFRFKTVLKDLRDLPAILAMLEAELGATIIKRDTAKFLEPLAWGWRIVVFDLRMANGQLVEYYLPVEEMERAKNDGNHELFEKWRNLDPRTLDTETRKEFHADQRQSQLAYEAAFKSFLGRSGATESALRAILIQAAASDSGMAKNSLYISSMSNEMPGSQVLRSSNDEAAKPSESMTITRPSGARDATAMLSPSTVNVAESRLRANAKSLVLLSFAAFPIAYLALYLQGYHKPGHHPDVGEGGASVLAVAAQVISIGFGSGTYRWWLPITAGLLVLGIATFRLLLRMSNRPAMLGTFAIFAGIIGVALVIGMGRAGINPEYGRASRYSYLTWSLLALACLQWTRERTWSGKWIPIILCVAAACFFIANTATGMKLGRGVRKGLAVIESDVRAGTPPEEIVKRFSEQPCQFQRGQEQRAVRAMPMLRDAGIGAFAESRP